MPEQPGFARRIAVVAGLLVGVVGCGATVVGPPILGGGRHALIEKLDVSLKIPVGMDRKKPHVWTLDAGGVRHAMLWVERKKLPETGAKGWVDAAAKRMGSSGMAGLIRREVVMIGDLDAHLLESITLLGRQRRAAMQLVAGAEDGLYVVSVLATLDTMKRNHKAFEKALRSTRIPRRQ